MFCSRSDSFLSAVSAGFAGRHRGIEPGHEGMLEVLQRAQPVAQFVEFHLRLDHIAVFGRIYAQALLKRFLNPTNRL